MNIIALLLWNSKDLTNELLVAYACNDLFASVIHAMFLYPLFISSSEHVSQHCTQYDGIVLSMFKILLDQWKLNPSFPSF